MSVRVRVAVALVVAAVVPLLGVFTIAGVLLPQSVGSERENRLGEASTATASILVRDCAAVGDRAALVASRLQVAVSVAAPDVSPEQAVSDAAATVVSAAAAPDDPWAVVLVDGDGQVLATGGPGAEAIAADPQPYLGRSCGAGEIGTPAALAVAVPVRLEGQQWGTVLAVSALDGLAVDRLAASVGLRRGSLVLLDGDGVLATSSTFPANLLGAPGPGTTGGRAPSPPSAPTRSSTSCRPRTSWPCSRSSSWSGSAPWRWARPSRPTTRRAPVRCGTASTCWPGPCSPATRPAARGCG